MAWTLNSDRPIYAQLVEKLKMQIVSGFYHPGDRLPSVRELAQEASVNPNTMQKAFSELEKSGLIITQRTSGRMVTEDLNMIKGIQLELAKENIKIFLENMKQLGYTEKEIVALIEEITKEEQDK